MDAIILCGGRGTRLGALTEFQQKTMIFVKGKPVLEHLIIMLKIAGVKRFFLSVGYRKENVMNYFGDGSKWGISIQYLSEESPMGTAYALFLAKKKISSTFLMINGDTLIDADIPSLVQFHIKSEKHATVALIKPPASQKGHVKTGEDLITTFIEKPPANDSTWINAGLYVMEPHVMDLADGNPQMLEKDIFPRLAEKKQLMGWKNTKRVFDIGTPLDLERANAEW